MIDPTDPVTTTMLEGAYNMGREMGAMASTTMEPPSEVTPDPELVQRLRRLLLLGFRDAVDAGWMRKTDTDDASGSTA